MWLDWRNNKRQRLGENVARRKQITLYLKVIDVASLCIYNIHLCSSKTRLLSSNETSGSEGALCCFFSSPFFSGTALDKNIQGSNVSWQPLWYIEGESKQGGPAMACDMDGVDQKWQQLSKDCRRTGSREKKRKGRKKDRNKTRATLDALKWPQEPWRVCLELRGKENHWLWAEIHRRGLHVPRVVFYKVPELMILFKGKQVFRCHISLSASADIWWPTSWNQLWSLLFSCQQIKYWLTTSWNKLSFFSFFILYYTLYGFCKIFKKYIYHARNILWYISCYYDVFMNM